jgi:hypothetical protein
MYYKIRGETPIIFFHSFGLIGLMYHANKKIFDLFLFTGIALKIYLNERPFEPRERDYASGILMSLPYGSVLDICAYESAKNI